VSRLRRSREEIEAARLLAGGSFFAQAISRAYYAAFYAAEEALSSVGESHSTHSGVISTFGRFVVREGGLDAEYGRILRLLFEGRGRADYDTEPIPRTSRCRHRGRRALRRRGRGLPRQRRRVMARFPP
jgi:uncharacterized protein (UPF0332 family)